MGLRGNHCSDPPLSPMLGLVLPSRVLRLQPEGRVVSVLGWEPGTIITPNNFLVFKGGSMCPLDCKGTIRVWGLYLPPEEER